MKRKSYRDYLIQYIDSLSPDDLILTDRAVSYACRKLKTPPEAARKAVNVTLARLEKEGYIIRLTKGVYCKKTKTAFGSYTPDKRELFCGSYPSSCYRNKRQLPLSPASRCHMRNGACPRRCPSPGRCTEAHRPVSQSEHGYSHSDGPEILSP